MDCLILNADLSPISLIPLSTAKWQDAIKAVFAGTVSVVAEYEDWQVHSPSVTIRVPSVVMTQRYLHFPRDVAFSDEQIFLRDHYQCQYCGKSFPPSKLTMDHVLPRKYGGQTTWDNISTACTPCNSKKGSNKKVVPSKRPRKPSYYEMIDLRKNYPLVVPCPQWGAYLGWPEENLFVREKEKKILRANGVS